jgi:hypothetical protein
LLPNLFGKGRRRVVFGDHARGEECQTDLPRAPAVASTAQNWRGQLLVSHQVIVQSIGSTTTETNYAAARAVPRGYYRHNTPASVLTAPVAGNTVANIAVEVAAAIACIIEFGVKDGRDDDRRRVLTELFVEPNSVPGFLSKETFVDVDRPGRRMLRQRWEKHGAAGLEICRHQNVRPTRAFQ